MAEIGVFALFCSCDLDLVQMTFIYQFDPNPLKLYPQTKNELSMSVAFEYYRITYTCTKRYTDIHVYIQGMA